MKRTSPSDTGFFITFEGIDGSGKSTQINLLKEMLTRENHEVEITREPGGSSLGKEIRNILLNPALPDPPGQLSEIFLFMADRAHHVNGVIKPALAAQKIVICDRFTDSTLVYQGYGRNFPLDELEHLNSLATDGLEPNLTIILDLPPNQADNRLEKTSNEFSENRDRLEQEAADFHTRVRNGYLDLVRRFPQRIHAISAELNIEEIHKQIANLVKKTLREKADV